MRKRSLPLPAIIASLRERKLPARVFVAWCAITAANFWIQTLALAEIPAGLYALIFALHPIVGILMVQATERGRPALSGRDAAGLALVLGGALLFLRGCDFGGHLPALWGWLALLGGIATWLIYSTLSRSLHKAGLEPAAVTWLTLAIGLLASLPVLVRPQAVLSTLQQTPAVAVCAVTAGIVGMFAFALYQHALRLAPRAAFLAQYAEPVAALAAAAVLLGESVSAGQAGAALLSLLGLGYLMRSAAI